MRGHTGEGAKLGDMKGAVGAGERGPLFPRLHVNETDKAGPKAPPRNKMALYEQFTVPSHCFVQRSQPSATPVHQQQYGSHELGHPYLRYYMPAVPYANTSHRVPVYSQPSHGTSSSGATNSSGVDSSHKFPRHHKVGKSSPCEVSRGLTEASTDCITIGSSELKGKNANARAQSSLTNLLEESTNSVHDVSPDTERPTVPDITGSLQEALSTVEVGMECTMAGGQSCSFLSSASQAVAGPGSALTGNETLSTYGHMNARKNSITGVEKANDSIGGLSVAALSKPDDESSEELKNIQNRTQHVKCGTRKGDHFDNLVVPSASFDSMPIIKPKNVIHAIGQQQFWKARKTLLRQQRVFADQVFQLHKLIKVQELLAKTPGTLIGEEVHFETIEERNVAAPLAKGAINPGEDAHNVGADFKEGSQDTTCEAGCQPKNKWEHTQAIGKDGLGSSKLMPEFHSGGVSTWGYPSLGQWVGPMAAQGRPFGYQPFAGTLPPGLALQGSVVSPMISFGIPYCDRRRELPAEMGWNYGPPTVFKHGGSGTVSCNSSRVSNNLVGGSWCNNSNQQRAHPTPSGKDVPSGSGVSVNKSPAGVQRVNTSCVPVLSYQWGQSGPSNTDSLKSYSHQSESSSPSIATRLKCQKSYSTPSTSTANMLGFSHPDVGGLAQNSDLGCAYGSRSSDHYDNSKGAEEEEELNTSLLRCSKSQKDGVSCLPIDGRVSDADEHSSDIDYSALELFPLVPSLSSSGQNRKKAAEEGQGRVIRAVPRRAIAASESAAGILLSLQRERQNCEINDYPIGANSHGRQRALEIWVGYPPFVPDH